MNYEMVVLYFTYLLKWLWPWNAGLKPIPVCTLDCSVRTYFQM